MIEVVLKDHTKNFWYVILPYEINNEFLFDIDQYSKKNNTKWGHIDIGASDFGNVEFPLEKLDKLYQDFDILEKNLDEIIKIVPLPKEIGGFDGFYRKGYITFFDEGIEEFKKYFPKISEEEISNIVNYGNVIDEPGNFTKKFTKEDMLLIISLIKKKILEAKEKGETLVFSGD